MQTNIYRTPREAGQAAALKTASTLIHAVDRQGYARMMVSTGQSQFEFFKALTAMNLPWPQVELFHLDEYIGLPITHKASFRKYLKERFIDKVTGASMHYISGEGDVASTIAELNALIRVHPVDIGVIGIGENAHIAFNDPPADFATKEPFLVVNLNESCKRQQVREGWFPSIKDVPTQAITMSPRQIMAARTILSIVPYKVKAAAVQNTLRSSLDNMIPATILKEHPAWTLFLDEESGAEP